jgi:hypothetical protein
VDSPDISLIEGITPRVIFGKLMKPLHQEEAFPDIHFSKGIPVCNSSIIVRSFDPIIKQNIFYKIQTSIGRISNKTYLLEKQVDGFFCTDGILLKPEKSNQIIYVYYYRNEFLCLDTSLNLFYKGKTIDTNSVAKIKVAKITSLNLETLSVPPLLVNEMACVSESHLFIRSNLCADNEDRKLFVTNSVIDIYSIKNGHYEFSFYLPDYKEMKVRNFFVHGNNLIALYGHYLACFQLGTR